MKKQIALWLVIAMLAASVTGCGDNTVETTAETAAVTEAVTETEEQDAASMAMTSHRAICPPPISRGTISASSPGKETTSSMTWAWSWS